MVPAKLAEIFEPRYPRRYVGKHRASRTRFIGTARVVTAGEPAATAAPESPAN